MENAQKVITLKDNQVAGNIFGKHDENLKLIEKNTNVKIVVRGLDINLTGQEESLAHIGGVFNHLIGLAEAGVNIALGDVNYALKAVTSETDQDITKALSEVVLHTNKGKQIKAKTLGQKNYLEAMRKYDLVFGIGPAGTGKTYLAVVTAVTALKNKEISKIILSRPAVEAGEKLGFLPGDLQEKVNPYLRPLYDGLYDVLGTETAQKYMERNVIEVAPLAYMRGRTLEDSFIILDEAQNTSPEQMKMFLTRIGFGSKAVITGDITQVDLPRGSKSGLVEVQQVLRDVEGISFCYLSDQDVVRHPLVQRIIRAYEEKEKVSTEK
ncbi:MAG: PhoH family protein [Bacillota bacterium]|nr:PhoH family protein [Bacillota bacterium]